MENEKNFAITRRRGFHMTFANGFTASVQWGSGCYCDNHDSLDYSFSKDAESNTAEVAVFDKDGEFLEPCDFFSGGDSDGMVSGYLTPEQVAEFFYNISNFKPM